MRIICLLILSVFFLVSCGNKNDGPLEEYEVEEIEDKLIEAMQKGKVKIYNDKGLKHEISFDDIKELIPQDSTGRYDLVGFGMLSEEEKAILNGDFNNNSTEIAAVSLYSLFSSGGFEQYLPVCQLDWKDVSKKLNANYRERFGDYLNDLFETNLDAYQQEISQLKLESVNENIFTALNAGTITAYENDNLSSVKSPNELKNYLARKVDQLVPDPEDSLETILKHAEIPVAASDISFYLPAYDEDENIVAITMMTHETFQGITINAPWVALDFDEVKAQLNESLLSFLLTHIEQVQAEAEAEAAMLDSIESE